MNYRDVRRVRTEAQSQIDAADMGVRDAAQLIIGRLQVARVDCDTLYRLKKELRNFNMTTYCWKESK